MERHAYLFILVLAWPGVMVLSCRLRLRVLGWRLARTLAITVPLFLIFDAAGAARGWFASSPRFNSLIVPPGIPIEEPILLGFLCLLSVVLWRLFSRRRGAA